MQKKTLLGTGTKITSDGHSQNNGLIEHNEIELLSTENIIDQRYKLLELIGQGGSGSLYKSEVLNSGQIVAIKLLKTESSDFGAANKRFLLEASSLAKLSHPNIVNIYDFGFDRNGNAFLVLHYVDGKTLEQFCSSKDFPKTEACLSILLQLCDALGYAHQANIVHRDVKPANIIVTGEHDTPSIKLVDFGIAKFSNDDTTNNVTKTGEVFGTPAFMSPEQCEGGVVDNRSDIYSFGCLMYWLVTGKYPFEGANAVQIALKQIGTNPPQMHSSQHSKKTLDSLEQITLRCLQKDRAKRYQSVQELERDLNLVQSGRTVDYAFGDGKELTSVSAVPKKTRLKTLFDMVCTFSLRVFGFILLVYTLAFLCSPFVPLRDGLPDVVRGGIGMTAGLGVLCYLRKIIKIVSTLKRRDQLSEWADDFLFLSIFSTFVFATLGAILGNLFLLNEIIPLGITISVASLILFFCSAVVFELFKNLLFLRQKFHGWHDFFQRCKAHQTGTGERFCIVKFSAAAKSYVVCSLIIALAFVAIDRSDASFVGGHVGRLYGMFRSSLAIPTLRLSVMLNPHNIYAWETLSEVTEVESTKEKALAVLNQAVQSNPESKKALLARGNVYYTLRQYDKAIENYSQGILLKSANVEDPDLLSEEYPLLAHRAQAFLAIGEFDRAREDLNKVIDQKDFNVPSSSKSVYYSDRGVVNYAQHKFPAAVADYSQALEQNGSNRARDFARRGIAYVAMNKTDLAKKSFQEAAGQYASDPKDALILAYAASKTGDNDSYVRNLQVAKDGGVGKERITELLLGDIPGEKIKW